MIFSYVLGDAVKNPGTGQHAQHGNQLTEVARLPNPAGAKGHRQQFHHQQPHANLDQRGARGPN
ncbi:hypothetical protein D3C87_1968120 [compost metagenome]